MAGFKRLTTMVAVLSLLAATVVVSAASAQAVVICGGEVATIVGTPGDDTLTGTPGNDVIASLQGDDIVKAGAGDDIICGGLGDDELFGGFGFDVIYGAQGNDLLISSKTKVGSDTAGSRMFGGADNDVIHGSTGWDRMQGGQGNDKLYGYGSRDWMRGGAGADVIDGGDWIDDVNGGYGNDTIFVDGADLIRGGPGKRDMCMFRSNFEEATVRGCEGRNGLPAPGSLGSATMARADWASGYIHAEILRQLMAEVGYDVSDPADLEVSPQLNYQQMGEGRIDFWANSWYPGHYVWWEQDLVDGTLVSDNIERVDGSLWSNGAPQGWLITKSWAEANNITTMDDLNRRSALAAQLPDLDRNGVGEVFTCQESWTCDDIAANMFEFAGWDNLQPLKAGYDAMFALFLDRVNNDQPAIMYLWTPSEYITSAIPGENVLWLSVEAGSVLDDSNPLGLRGGENHGQPNPATGLGADVCTIGPDGCNLGWAASDITITANSEWLANNPVAAELFRQFRPSIIEISGLHFEQRQGNGSQDEVVRLATEYINANRGLMDQWLQAAAAAR